MRSFRERRGLRFCLPSIALLVLLTALACPSGAADPKGTADDKAGVGSPGDTPGTEQRGRESPRPADSPPDEDPAEYAMCSPSFPGEQVAVLMQFVKFLAPDLVPKLRSLLLKCDVELNNLLLAFIEDLQEEIASSEFDSDEQQQLFLTEKAKELEIQLVLLQKPVNQEELKKLVSEQFDLRHKRMQAHLTDLEKEVAALKQRVHEREDLKDQIVAQRVKDILDMPRQRAAKEETSKEEASMDDKLFWD
jgi:hypothetical protein